MMAKYRCMKCGHEWEGQPGPVTCPKCEHFYIKWVNHEAWAKANPTAKDPYYVAAKTRHP